MSNKTELLLSRGATALALALIFLGACTPAISNTTQTPKPGTDIRVGEIEILLAPDGSPLQRECQTLMNFTTIAGPQLPQDNMNIVGISAQQIKTEGPINYYSVFPTMEFSPDETPVATSENNNDSLITTNTPGQTWRVFTFAKGLDRSSRPLVFPSPPDSEGRAYGRFNSAPPAQIGVDTNRLTADGSSMCLIVHDFTDGRHVSDHVHTGQSSAAGITIYKSP
ncbi:hypothetical protein A2866_03740 [Candidatus Roizmanbacteria bacterium RIFCSPHIGHO2_01_FULL_39_8]|uniref:CHRD domain-containing protein n=2 Tax=Candidatus Roizmaniibacteriota TaxID=1752723 RepID=A0A1F7GLY3_9BACT|nr:MAG: hypothetical protein A2866_03740 [Candidatus Roizmanbacteria bacterium RIFCSPHIGHO2_01_FULL_39_8]OGK27179.1 MAG: hypothetical protein A3C28_06590 [Candidatus Roizmanbacteria bacterium RIFCSPHIGHO2_02_FULL_39_9]